MTSDPPPSSPVARVPGTKETGHVDRTADVAIIGAGLAGLTAALRLTQAGRSTCVLEARDRDGGRVLNAAIGDGEVLEVGGQWVGPTQRRVHALADELGIGTFPTHAEGEHLIEFEGELRRYRGVIPPVSARVLADVAQARFRLDRMARAVPIEAPWRARKAEELDTQTFWTWIRRNTSPPAPGPCFNSPPRRYGLLILESSHSCTYSSTSTQRAALTSSSEQKAARSKTASSVAPSALLSGWRTCWASGQRRAR